MKFVSGCSCDDIKEQLHKALAGEEAGYCEIHRPWVEKPEDHKSPTENDEFAAIEAAVMHGHGFMSPDGNSYKTRAEYQQAQRDERANKGVALNNPDAGDRVRRLLNGPLGN